MYVYIYIYLDEMDSSLSEDFLCPWPKYFMLIKYVMKIIPYNIQANMSKANMSKFPSR